MLGRLAAPLPKGLARATRKVQKIGNRFFMPPILRKKSATAILKAWQKNTTGSRGTIEEK